MPEVSSKKYIHVLNISLRIAFETTLVTQILTIVSEESLSYLKYILGSKR